MTESIKQMADKYEQAMKDWSADSIKKTEVIVKLEAENKKLRSRYDSLKYSCEAYISYFESSQFCKLNCDPSSNFHEPECSFVTNIFKALSSGGQ